MSVQELESAVTTLSAEELHHFAQWFEEYLSSQWDTQISADAAAGKLKALLDEADADYESLKGFGCLRGKILLVPDFEEPIADFKEYSA